MGPVLVLFPRPYCANRSRLKFVLLIVEHRVTMLIYKDAISGDELFSDTYPIELLHDCVYKVKGKQETRKEGCDFDIGANASQEEQAEQIEDGSLVSGVNVCLDNRLCETAFSKKEYQTYIKTYMGAIKKKLECEGKDEECKKFQAGMSCFMKDMLKQFSELQFFQTESMNSEGMIPLCVWDGETPYMYFFKHGVDEEKV